MTHNMLATAVGVDRIVERDVRGLVAAEDGPRLLLDDLRGGRQVLLGGGLVERAPAVVVLLPLALLEAVRHGRRRAAALDRVQGHEVRLGGSDAGLGGRHAVNIYSFSTPCSPPPPGTATPCAVTVVCRDTRVGVRRRARGPVFRQR